MKYTMRCSELNLGDVIILKDKDGYMEHVLKYGGTFWPNKSGKVIGFAVDVGHIMKIKIDLEDEHGEVFYLHEDDLKFWTYDTGR